MRYSVTFSSLLGDCLPVLQFTVAHDHVNSLVVSIEAHRDVGLQIVPITQDRIFSFSPPDLIQDRQKRAKTTLLDGETEEISLVVVPVPILVL